MKLRIARVVIGFLLALSLFQLTFAQTSTQTASALPRLVRFGGTAKDLNGSPLTGVVGITFALYSEQTGGAPLWLETQNVTADSSGHYTALLGSTKSDGLPAELFTSEQARWVGVQVSGQAEQPRVLLVSAPYALKAGDAETVGGLPPSAFVLAAPAAGGSAANGPAANAVGSASPSTATDVTTTGGTVNYLPIFNGASTIVDSVLFQSATSPFKIGINTITPATTLDVNGGGTVRGTLSLPATAAATATAGKDSQALSLVASSFSSTSVAAVNQTFHWQAEPVANNTASPSGLLSLLYGLGATAPSETGLKISSKGIFTFAPGQTFPGTGTITGITTAAGSGLAGGGTSGTLSLKVPAAGITNAMLATSYAQLGAANTFTGNQTVTGTITSNATGLGVQAIASSVNGVAIDGYSSATTGYGYGVEGVTKAPAGAGVSGTNLAETGGAVGVLGITNSSTGYGVDGQNNARTGLAVGVYGLSYSPAGYGVQGFNQAATGTTAGVYGSTSSPAGYGLEGVDGASSGGTAGFFQVSKASATILQGNNGSTTEFTVDAAGDLIAAGVVTGSGFQIGGNLFDYGSAANSNAFLGFAGNTTMAGTANTASGFDALFTNTTGVENTASGVLSLENNCIPSASCSPGQGSGNTADGTYALLSTTTGSYNTGAGYFSGSALDGSYGTGSYNTALGAYARSSTGTLTNATAIGANAVVGESNALVLGAITGLNGGTSVNVGIGTTTPGHLLDVAGTLAVDSTGLNNGTGIDLTFGLSAGEGISSSRTAGPNQYGIDLYTDFNRRISIEQYGNVGIGTTTPDNLLTVNGSADKPGGGSWGTFSDARLKTVNGSFTDGLSQIMKIHPIHYRYKPDNAMGIRDADEHIGVVAQEVKQVIPEAVTENSKGYLLVNNDPIIWTMLNAIKEQQREIKQQQSLLRAQSAAMRSLKAEVRETRETLRKVKAQVAASQLAVVAAK
ncbi:MAG: tail fiber domain-containing protein [Terriglobales bacterium]